MSRHLRFQSGPMSKTRRGRTRKIGRTFLACALLMVSLCLPALGALLNGLLFTHTGWDYSAANLIEGTLHKYWWCGAGTIPGTTGTTDVIYYRYMDNSTGQWSSISEVLWPTLNSWEDGHGAGTCNPSVIRGTFTPGNGSTYGYAMYYVAQNDSHNKIGVAFSNDGVTWTKYANNPIIYPQVFPHTGYGAGAPSAFNVNGSSSIYLFQYDDSVANPLSAGFPYWWRTSTDGIHFGVTSPVHSPGAGWFYPTEMAYDPTSGNYYSTIVSPARSGDSEGYQFGIFQIPSGQLLSGQNGWQLLGVVDTNTTASYLNVQPRLLRDAYGNIMTSWLPTLQITFGGGTNASSTWDLHWVDLNVQNKTLAFSRYGNPNVGPVGDLWSTTGAVTSGYTGGNYQGFLLQAPAANTRALYGCVAIYDHFISIQSNCEGWSILGINGWAYTSPPSGISTIALYRCQIATSKGTDLFVSLDPNCEGWGTGTWIGYAKSTQ